MHLVQQSPARHRRWNAREADRLMAIRAIVSAAGDAETADVMAQSLVALGATQQEIATALQGSAG